LQYNLQIHFQHYKIRPIEAKDSAEYYRFIENNRKHIEFYFPRTSEAVADLESAKAHVASRTRMAIQKEFFTYVIEDTLLQNIIGAIFLMRIDWAVPKGEIGFFLDHNYHRKGIMSESISLFCKSCIHEWGFNRIFMRISPENKASIRVAEKNNFILEGLLRNDFKTGDGKLIDLMYYSMIS
jgi:RimJ/RimL family protein N-acetyltransferase